MSHLNCKMPSKQELGQLDSFDLAFLVLSGRAKMQPQPLLLKVMKFSKHTRLFGPEAFILAQAMARAWDKHGAKMIDEIVGAFDVETVSVKAGQVRTALKEGKAIGKLIWDEVRHPVKDLFFKCQLRAQEHFKEQLPKAKYDGDPADFQFTQHEWDQYVTQSLSDHLQHFVETYPERVLDPQLENLIKIVQESEVHRLIDKAGLADRLQALATMPQEYLGFSGDVHMGRVWSFTGLQMAHVNHVETFMSKAQWDKVTCEVCARLDGKEFNVESTYEAMVNYLNGVPGDDLMDFPRVADIDNQSQDELRTMGLCPPYHGRCYIEGTEVYTDRGWVDFRELNGTDRFLSREPGGNLIWLPALRLVVNDFKGNLIRLSTRWFELTVTPDHEQPFEKRVDRGMSGRAWESSSLPIHELINLKEYRIPRTGHWSGDASAGEKLSCFQYRGSEACSMGDFAEFMGYYLAEGSVSPRSKGNGLQISIAQDHRHILRMKDACNRVAGFGNCKLGDGKIYIDNQPLSVFLSRFGKSHEKYVPVEIKEATVEVIQIFLAAYLLGDGSAGKSSWEEKGFHTDRARFDTSSRKMAGDLGELILKVGGCPSFGFSARAGDVMACPRSGKNYRVNHDVWRISWNRSNSATSQSIVVDQVSYNGKVYCVELESNHVLWVRQNGKTCFSGNCRCDVVMIGVSNQAPEYEPVGIAPSQVDSVLAGPDGQTFARYAGEWLRSSDGEAKELAYALAQREYILQEALWAEHYGIDTIPQEARLFRVGALETGSGSIGSFFTTEEAAAAYQQRFGVESVHEFVAPIGTVVPSGSGAGEVWADVNEIREV